MTDQPINSQTLIALKDYQSNPGQAVGLIGQKWTNKGQVARLLAERLLEIKPNSLINYPYYLNLGSDDSNITIDEIRSLNDFLVLKVPVKKDINRVVIIDNAQLMRLEAQNALLKNLEEPPTGTVFILTFEASRLLLPTITSRLATIKVDKPGKDQLIDYYKQLGYSDSDINQAYLIADGLPELMDQLLTDKDSSINQAVVEARKLLSSTTFERLSTVNDLAKDKNELKNVLFIIKQMSKIGLMSKDPKSSKRWQKVLSSTLNSEDKLRANTQVKLLLTDYILSLG